MRRLECVLEPTREDVVKTFASLKDSGIDTDIILRQQTSFPFFNASEYSLQSLAATRTRQNLKDYIAQFSDNARVIFEQFDFADTIAGMDRAGVLYRICQNFAAIDLHPDAVPERVMSNVYEHLNRKFGAEVNEAAEDFMTPRDLVHLAIELLLDPDDQLFIDNPGLIPTLYDPAFRDETDGEIGIKGYEINFNCYFYEYMPPRDLDEIDAELNSVEAEIAAMLAEVAR